MSEHAPLLPKPAAVGKLHRGLSARQVQMIAVAGTIGTGLFLGTGRSLAQGGPAALLVCYALIGAVVYVTLLLLGEMATQYPVAASFNAYATRFVDDAYGFALAWNYWLNDAVSVAADLTAAQLVLAYWSPHNLWLISILFLLFLLAINAFSVGAYGELEYWLSSVKVLTIVVFVVVGALVNAGYNTSHRVIGADNWRIPGAPFVGGFAGFSQVFVTASFAYGGTESLGLTAGETKNPARNMPRVVKFVFFRILLFYILSILFIGLNVPWDYPDLANKDVTTSPFTIVFTQAGSTAAASLMNTVILSSVLSAGNHALFAGTRVLHGLALAGHAPRALAHTSRAGAPWPALLATAAVAALCLACAAVGRGELWGWLQNLVGVSNQIAWLSIGLASWRFRRAWTLQRRPRAELVFQGARWTWGWGPPFVVGTVAALILVQGYSAFTPVFRPATALSLYAQLPLMAALFAARRLRGTPRVDLAALDLRAQEHAPGAAERAEEAARGARVRGRGVRACAWRVWYFVA